MKMFVTKPFPGMNPWLEAFWGDIHARLTMYACDAIEQRLPRGLQARVEEYLAIEGPVELDRSGRRIVPDVTIFDTRSSGTKAAPHGVATIDGAEPMVIQRLAEPMTLRYIEIVDLMDARRVVAAIEFASPANKTEQGMVQYTSKQRKLLAGGVHLIEIDLLRKGEWILAADQSCYPLSFANPYRICVTRGTAAEQSEVYRASYAFPLPSIRIPLRPTDADIALPLQSLLDQAYVNGRYGDSIDYDKPPAIPLNDTERSEVSQILLQRV
jgi:hypothetical protein